MSTCAVKDFLGYAALKKISGSGAITAGTQVNLPVTLVQPRNPMSISFPDVINSSAYRTVSLLDKKLPTLSLTTYVKSNWLSANLLNSLIVTLDGGYDTDVWSIAVASEDKTTHVWDDARCSALRLSQSSYGGPLQMSLDFVATYGDSEKSSPATFTTPTAPSTGSLIDVAHVDFNNTASQVRGWTLNITRAQTPVYFIDGTYYSACIASGPLLGMLTLTQSASAVTVPSTAATIRIYTNPAMPPSGAKVTISMQLQLMELLRDYTPDLGVATRNYQLVSLGAQPVSFS
jgi:hypothetical protein